MSNTHSTIKLNKEKEFELINKFQVSTFDCDKNAAYNELYKANYGLIKKIACDYLYIKDANFDDLFICAQEGFAKALSLFNTSASTRLSTFATYHIKECITKYIENECRTIRLPSYVYDDMSTIKKATLSFINNHDGDKPTLDELVNEINNKRFTTERIKNTLDAFNPIICLDDYLKEDSETTLIDTINGDYEEYVEDVELTDNTSTICETFFSVLNERERYVMKCKFGFEGEEEQNDQRIADKIGVARQYVCKIVEQAQAKLRLYATQNHIENPLP